LEARFVYLCAEPSLQKKAPEILVVGSGKGGVGKSCLAVNAAVTAARKGWRVILCIEPTNLGFMFFDKCVPDAVNSGTPFVVSHPHLKISGCVADIINRLGYV
jgi:MinD-like ATPase involved in chromosome partitioning or flagellar assembly